MIKIPRNPIIFFVAAGTAIGVVVASLPALSAPALAPRMTVTELANGLLFNQGRAARYLVVLNRPAVQMTRETVAVEHSVDHALATHRAQAHRFASDVQSGNRIKVKAGLAILTKFGYHASDIVLGRSVTQKAVTKARAMLGNPALSPIARPDELALADFLWYVLYYFIVLLIPFSVGQGSSGSLAADRVVNLVATSLQAAR